MKTYTLEAVLERLEDDIVILKVADQKLSWPKKQFPKDVKPGERLFLELHSSEDLEQDQGKMAKSILNEILKDENADSK